MLLSSHLLDRVQSVCDRVALFNKGKIALMGTVIELADQVLGGGHPIWSRPRARISPAPCAASRACKRSCRKARARWRVMADRDVRAAAAQRIVSAGGSLTRLADLQPSLEEVYTRYFQEARHAA